MKLSDYVIDFLEKQGIQHVFELIGGAITHLIDSIYNRNDIQCISVHHEQSAAFAAEAYARINGKLGVAMATSGPGALNLLTGIGSCYFDSVPCLFITGQVNTYEYKFDRPLRQVGFQETDIVNVVKPLTKYAEMVIDASKIKYYLEKAVFLAQTGRPGPVLLDIPMNIQRAEIEPEELLGFYDSREFSQYKHLYTDDTQDIKKVIDLISVAKRPLILAGGGVRTANACTELLALVEKTGIPVVTSLMGIDVIPHNIPAFLGMIGAYGNRYSNLALANCDFLLILGSRLDSRQTGTRPETFARGAQKVHVDIDSNELNAKLYVDLAINQNIREFLIRLNNQDFFISNLIEWHKIIREYKQKFPLFVSRTTASGGINPNYFMELLSSYCAIGDIVCLDVGQNQIWAAQSFRIKDNQRMLISGGMGSMGFALPAAIGATQAASGKKVVGISGDGGIQINIQELDIVAQRKLPVKMFIMNNGCLGMVRQFQEMYFDGREQSTVIGYSCPELDQIAAAYGIPSFVIDDEKNAKTIIVEALSVDGPAFVNVLLDRDTYVNPKLVVNKPIEDMSPHLDKKELKELMLIDLLIETE
jgi:acetolactate synthase-1/2/3 large subunit